MSRAEAERPPPTCSTGSLTLTAAEREHLFALAQGRPPGPLPRARERVTPRLQRLLDSLEFIPAFVKTPTWDVVAWNRAASVVLTDYASLPPERRNILRLLFAGPSLRSQLPSWENDARLALATFRLETTRNGAHNEARALVDEQSECSPEFASMWREADVGSYGAGTKRIAHSSLGSLALEYPAFNVDGQPDLCLVIYTPATPGDTERVRSILAG